MKRNWSLWTLIVGLVGLLVVVNTTSVAATPPSGLTNVPVARGTDKSVGTLPLEQGTDIVMAQITVVPGGSSGWHSHPGGAIVVIKQGALTRYRARGEDGREAEDSQSSGGRCEATQFTAGQAFIERPGEVDQVVNTGTIPYILFVTFPRVPVGGSARIDQPDPGVCPGL